MPTPRLQPGHPSWPEVERAAALRDAGLRTSDIAYQLGIDWGKANHWLKTYDLHENLSEGVKAALERTGVSTDEAKFGWRVDVDEDGNRNSVFWKMPEGGAEDLIDQIRGAFLDIPQAAKVKPPKIERADLLNLVNVSDLHAGMLADADEVGEGYKTTKATKRLIDWTADCLARAPKADECVILFNGDTLHGNDETNATPRSKHVLDVDGRFVRTVHMTVQAIAITIDQALRTHSHVTVVIKPGNHDPTAYLSLCVGMAQRYHADDRVTVETAAMEFWAMRFGKVLLASHHGHKAKPQQLVSFFSAQFAREWGQTEYRYLWTGHMHHLRQQELHGMVHEQARAAAPRDSHAFNSAYSSMAEIQTVTYHRERGEIARVRVSA